MSFVAPAASAAFSSLQGVAAAAGPLLKGAAAIAVPAAQIIAPLMQSRSAATEGRQVQEAYNYNANIADLEAEAATAAGRVEDMQLARRGALLRSTQTAIYARSGVMLSGSALDVMVQSAAQVELDRSLSRYNTALTAARARSKADMQRYYGRVYGQAGRVNTASSLLTGLPKIIEGAGTLVTLASKLLKPTAGKATVPTGATP